MSSLRPNPYPRRQPSFPGTSPAQLGMYIGLASLTMVFGATLVAYFITRAQSTAWRDADLPGLPPGLGISTLLLVLVSGALHFGERRLRRNERRRLQRALGVALLLSVAFLLAQAQNWRTLFVQSLGRSQKSLYEFTFYLLTGLHAVHVLGGLLALLWVYGRATRDHYSSSNSEGVRLALQYWDFLLVVWFVLLGSLLVTQ